MHYFLRDSQTLFNESSIRVGPSGLLSRCHNTIMIIENLTVLVVVEMVHLQTEKWFQFWLKATYLQYKTVVLSKPKPLCN
jgi:hypothetical protein